MRTSAEIQKRLSTLTQALYFQGVHREELTEKGRAQLKALEESIALLDWTLQQPDAGVLTWKCVLNAFAASFRLLWMRITRRRPSHDGAHAPPDSPMELNPEIRSDHE